MADKDNGGAAFPYTSDGGPWDTGMTLRDWFAGQALAGIMSDENWHNLEPTFAAKSSYIMADAMLAARSK